MYYLYPQLFKQVLVLTMECYVAQMLVAQEHPPPLPPPPPTIPSRYALIGLLDLWILHVMWNVKTTPKNADLKLSQIKCINMYQNDSFRRFLNEA